MAIVTESPHRRRAATLLKSTRDVVSEQDTRIRQEAEEEKIHLLSF